MHPTMVDWVCRELVMSWGVCCCSYMPRAERLRLWSLPRAMSYRGLMRAKAWRPTGQDPRVFAVPQPHLGQVLLSTQSSLRDSSFLVNITTEQTTNQRMSSSYIYTDYDAREWPNKFPNGFKVKAENQSAPWLGSLKYLGWVLPTPGKH